jgi:hypothetical protein
VVRGAGQPSRIKSGVTEYVEQGQGHNPHRPADITPSRFLNIESESTDLAELLDQVIQFVRRWNSS